MQETRIFDLLDRYESVFSNKSNVFGAKEDGKWQTYSTKEYIKYANYFSFGLLDMGFNVGDKIATISNNRPEWNFVDMGMLQIGAVHVPIYPSISDDEYRYILSHSEARILIVSDKELYTRLKPIADSLNSIEGVYTFDKINGVRHWSEIVEKGKNLDDEVYLKKVQDIKSQISKDDLATVIYTSGTTGMPKGVMLSHWNFMYQVQEIKKIITIDHRHSILSFLPLCHVLERIGGYAFQFMGISIYYAEGTDTIADNVKEIKPAGFVTVPRLLERVFDKIIAKGKELSPVKKNLFFWAVNLGFNYNEKGNSLYYKIQLKIADKLIFKKWREALGNNIKLIISGGAALQPRLARIFWAAGIPVQEGYGLTETAPVICVNRDKYPDLNIGTVGPKLGKEQEIKIAEDGEVLFRGPNLMLGYYKDEEKTAKAIDEEGWFHTGDIGEIIDGQYLKITDRKKEMFKLSTGKYVAPQPVENLFKESIFIEQIMVVGEGEKFAAALISPNFEFLHDWCHVKKIRYRENKDLVQVPEVVERYQKEVDEYNQRLGKTEQIKQFRLVCEEWTPENGELSPTLKLKRRFVKEKYKHRLLELYPSKELVSSQV